MARSILKIDVDDAAFKRFEEAFKKYEKARLSLDKKPLVTPQDVRNTEVVVKKEIGLIDGRGKAAAALATGQKILAEHAHKAARAWDTISVRSRQVKDNVIKIAQVTGLSALIGLGGGLFGADRLALSASAGRRSSSGLGVSYGEQQAFGLTYGRLVDTGSFLGGVSQAKGNVASPARAALLALGVNPDSGGDIIGQTMDRVRELAKSTPEHLLGVLPQSHNLDALGLDVETLRRLKGTSEEEYAQFRGERSRRRSQLDVSDPALKASQDFAVQLDVAGEKIKSSLIIGLSTLAPHLTKISDSLSDMAQKILGSKGVKDGLEWLAGGLKRFGDYVQNEGFQKDIKEFVAGVAAMADAIGRGLKLLGIIPSGPSGGIASGPPAIMSYEDWVKKREEDMKSMAPIFQERMRKNHRQSYDDYKKQMGATNASYDMGGITDPQIKALAAGHAGLESGGRYDATGPWVNGKNGYRDRAYGKYQIMGANIGPWSKELTGNAASIDEFTMNPRLQDAIYQMKMKQYITKYGNVADAYSMWHSGVPLAQAIKEGRRDVNMSTEAYVGRLMGGTKIVLENNTGGNTITQTNQIAY